MSKPDPGSGAYVPRIRRSRSGWTWKARLALAALACAFAGTAQAQDYRSLDLALSRIIGEIVDDGELRGRTVLVSPNSFIEMGTGRNLPLSSLLARQSIPELRRQGARPVSGSDDEDRAVTLRGEWSIEHESGEPYLYLFMEAKQLVGKNELSTLASDHGRIPVASIDRRLLDPDIESHGRHVVRGLEQRIPGADGRYRLHVRPFTLQGMAKPESERFNRYLLGQWRPAFAGSRRLRLVGPARFDGELIGDVFVVGERIQVSLYIRDDQEREVAAAFVEMDRNLFPPGMFGPDVRKLLVRCAGEADAGRLGVARKCYEEARASAPGDSDVGEGVRAGLERIAVLEAEARAVGDVEEAIGRGALDEARRRLEDLRRLNAGHSRLAELERGLARAERRAEAERERKAEERRRADAAAFATLAVRTVPSGAQVRIATNDGATAYREGMRLEPGRYRIEVEARDHEPFRQDLDITGNTEYEISLCRLEQRTKHECTDEEVTRYRTERRRSLRTTVYQGTVDAVDLPEIEFTYEYFTGREFLRQRRGIEQILCSYARVMADDKALRARCRDIGASYDPLAAYGFRDRLDCECEIDGDYDTDYCELTGDFSCIVTKEVQVPYPTMEEKCEDKIQTERICPENQVTLRSR